MKVPEGIEVSIDGKTFSGEIPDNKVSGPLRTMLEKKNKQLADAENNSTPKAEKTKK